MLPAVLSLETLLNMSEVADLKYAGFYPMMPMPVPYPFNPVLGPRQHLPAFVSPKMQKNENTDQNKGKITKFVFLMYFLTLLGMIER